MIIGPGQTVRISLPIEQRPDGSWGGEWKEGDPPLHTETVSGANAEVGFHWIDRSRETFGKYQCCTMHRGLWYSDDDFSIGNGCGWLRWGSIPSPQSPDRRPWRGEIVELIRRACGARREK